MSNHKGPLLKVENLKMHFSLKRGLLDKQDKVVKAVDGVSFEVHKGRTLGIVGESGCGKTTIGKCILRIHQASSGKIFFNGQDILGMSERNFSKIKRKMQMIFQDPYGSLDPRQSAFSIVKETYVEDRKRQPARVVKEEVEKLLVRVGLPVELGIRYPHELSGGQRQRLGIARALATDPELIICDEPVSALDVSIQAQIINLFKQLQRQMQLTYIFIAHDLAVVRHIADRVAVMYLGRFVEHMDAAELYSNPLHPYTKSLLSAIPIIDYDAERQRKRIILKGEVPSPINVPSGCAFHPRCPVASSICAEVVPGLEDIGNGHYVACHHLDLAREMVMIGPQSQKPA
ncbi:MAG: ATP-binding cassette domain-containing protein [Firmicutes bacterium]|jgi:peptide/nickel transport system ATP-binding protein/oligopeptide transport system ATP-binding protein|nr:ATP-binding cassette domain-containing protein [Bacillota bacterium]HPU01908.1 ATP-binding cassette domain-containing protein [Bacillota bacterium]